MTSRWVRLTAGAMALAGCGDYAQPATPTADTALHDVAGADVGGSDTSLADGASGDVDPGEPSIPCAVRTFLADNCVSCHGATLVGESPMPLLTYEDFLAPSRIDPSKTIADVSRTRIRSATKPMPPTPTVVPEADLTAFEEWLALGMPSEACDMPAPFDPFGGTPGCTSGTYWTRGDRGANIMHPGGECIACHTREVAERPPSYRLAGTLFPSGRDVDDCNGVTSASGAQVEVIDANGTVLRMRPNSAGNFYITLASSPGFTFPYTARVVDSAGKVRAMIGEQMNGDCNSCHTSLGAEGAPGRIVVP